MSKTVLPFAINESGAGFDSEAVLNALAAAVVVIDAENTITRVNMAGEQLLKGSAPHLQGQALSAMLPEDSPIFSLLNQVRSNGTPVSEYGIVLESPRIGRCDVNIQAAPMADAPGWVVLSFQERSIADKIDRQLNHRGAARSVSAMAAMLAHEVKNPLSGIRGGAQLLEENLTAEDRELTRMIRDETDRICALVDRMEAFSDGGPIERDAVNIHRVLDHVRRLAETGFGKQVRFVAEFDPSLPRVLGNRDQLIQVFLNLVKNACEAVPETGGEIVLSTSYRHGVRFAVSGTGSRVHLPLMISVRDTGDGIPEDMRPHLFDAFVTSKPKGSGLGLALVAKIIGDHGGVIEFDSQSRGTVFRVMLPMATEEVQGGETRT